MTFPADPKSAFLRGLAAAVQYYCAAAVVLLLLKIVIPASDHIYLFFILLPAVLLGGLAWLIVSLFTLRRPRSRGALVIHLVILVSGGLLFPPRVPEFPGAGPNAASGELMPTFKNLHDQERFLSAYREELRSWPVPVEESDIGTSFGSTHVITFGNPEGMPLMLLHWFYSNSTEWKYMAPLLQERYHVFAVDVIGDMGKSYAYNPPKSEKEVSEWFNQVLAGLGIGRISVCGHSNGGFQAMLIAMQDPGKVDKLILMAPAAGFSPFSAKFYLTSFGTAFFPRDIILKSFKNAGTMKPERWSREMDEMLALSFSVASNQLRVYPREFGDDELKAITIPALLLLGDREMIYSPEEVAGKAVKTIPGIKVVSIPHCGHAIPFDAPEKAAGAIDLFYDQP